MLQISLTFVMLNQERCTSHWFKLRRDPVELHGLHRDGAGLEVSQAFLLAATG